MIKIKVKVEDLQDGDIFYTRNIPMETNEEQFGEDVATSGEDLILIVDDRDIMEDLVGIYTNGGYYFEFEKGTEVFLIGHYGDLIKEADNLK